MSVDPMRCIVQYYGRQLTDDELRDSINHTNGRPYTFLQYVLVCSRFVKDAGHMQALLAKCMAYNAHINIQDMWGCTALHYAVACPPATLETLCLAGAKLHIRDRNGATPLDKTVGRSDAREHARLLTAYAARDARCTAAIVALLNRRVREAKQLPRDVAHIIGRMLWAPKSRRSEVWGE